MTLILSTHDSALVARAAAHCLADGEPVIWTNATDLDIARLIMRIERGSIIVPSAVSNAWFALNEIERERHLTRIVKEAIRVGLVQAVSIRTGPHTRRTQLVAAPTHSRWAPGVPACPAVLGMRYRLLDEPELVDCMECLALGLAVKRTGQAY